MQINDGVLPVRPSVMSTSLQRRNAKKNANDVRPRVAQGDWNVPLELEPVS